MKQIYFDNAATTAMDSQVIDLMTEVMRTNYGNASSVHQTGNSSKDLIEDARLSMADLLHIKPSELFFTSGATESINTQIQGMVNSLGIEHIITSKLEHSAVLEAATQARKAYHTKLSFVEFDEKGDINLEHLKNLLNSSEKTAICLMHVNNELGNILPLGEVREIGNEFSAIFMSDTVQSMGKMEVNLSDNLLDFAVGSAHKFHGPKGIGFMYINGNNRISPWIRGGAQERNMRAGTENIAGIVGMAKAFEIAYANMEKDFNHISMLKNHLIKEIKEHIPTAMFNGNIQGIHTILNIGFPKSSHNKMIVFNLDMQGIAVSGGSACSSGVMNTSHVIKALAKEKEIIPLRVSFGKYNSMEEVNRLVEVLKKY